MTLIVSCPWFREEKMKSLSLFLFTCCDLLELFLAEELYTGT